LLSIEWTSQHGCGNPREYCNVVIQYMCGDTDAPADTFIRDGTTTDEIETTAESVAEKDPDTGDYLFGMHEPLAQYTACSTRERNFGLFIADRATEGNLNEGRRIVIFTR